MKEILFGAAVAAVLMMGVYVALMPKNVPLDGEPPVGATPGTDHYSPESFLQPITQGGNVLATTSQGAGTYTAANLQNTSLIQHTAGAALTVTLPASSTLGAFIPRPGDTRTIYFNAITTLITIAGGTGTELNTASSTKNVNAGGIGRLDFTRKANTDIEVLLTTGI